MELFRTISSPSMEAERRSDFSIMALKHSCAKRFVGCLKEVIAGM